MNIEFLNNPNGLFDAASQVFWGQWGNDDNFEFYVDCMRQSIHTEEDLPLF